MELVPAFEIALNLFVGHDDLDGALDVLERAGVVIDREAATRADREGDVLVGHCGGLRVDLFTPSIPFAWEAMKTRRRMGEEDPRVRAWDDILARVGER